jgi:agmatine deiminase
MSKRLSNTPKQDGFRMPGEFEPQEKVWMLWPERSDNWRDGGKPAQKQYAAVAEAINKYTPVTMLVNQSQYDNARNILSSSIRVIEMSNDDAWLRDSGPTFVINDNGDIRGIDWAFNAYGGFVDGLYFPWANDDALARKICEIEDIDTYHTPDFILEGGSIHCDGEGTVITTEMCLLSEGRNSSMSRIQIEQKLKDYLNVSKVVWVKDGIDPEETNGHIDDVVCFVKPGEVVCIWTDDEENIFYNACHEAYKSLKNSVDAKGRKLKVHKLTMPKGYVKIKGDFAIDTIEGTIPREDGDICIASYMNFLISNGALIVPQYGDVNDELALEQLKAIYPEYEVIGVPSWEVVYGGGNIHCITQQQPKIIK